MMAKHSKANIRTKIITRITARAITLTISMTKQTTFDANSYDANDFNKFDLGSEIKLHENANII